MNNHQLMNLMPTPMSKRRSATVILLTLLPWPAVWLGMYKLNSIVWTFFLYHGVCLLPPVVWGYPLWRSGLKRPTVKQWILIAICGTATALVAQIAYKLSGQMIVSRDQILSVLTARGLLAGWTIPLAAYFVVINATLEELFWRGVILNELDYLNKKIRLLGTVWTAATFAAWHWLVIRLLIKPGWAELTIVGILAMGFFTSWIYRRTESIVLPILWHALVFDLAIILLFIILLQ
jgi:membrane protease YdiL (CAAX protease family)